MWEYSFTKITQAWEGICNGTSLSARIFGPTIRSFLLRIMQGEINVKWAESKPLHFAVDNFSANDSTYGVAYFSNIQEILNTVLKLTSLERQMSTNLIGCHWPCKINWWIFSAPSVAALLKVGLQIINSLFGGVARQRKQVHGVVTLKIVLHSMFSALQIGWYWYFEWWYELIDEIRSRNKELLVHMRGVAEDGKWKTFCGLSCLVVRNCSAVDEHSHKVYQKQWCCESIKATCCLNSQRPPASIC